jgi:hypothetical protein
MAVKKELQHAELGTRIQAASMKSVRQDISMLYVDGKHFVVSTAHLDIPDLGIVDITQLL